MRDRRPSLRQYAAPVLGGVFLLLLLGIWAWQEHWRVRAQAILQIRESGEAVSRALVGSMRPWMRHGRFRRDRLTETLESVVETTGIRFVVIRDGHGTVAVAGEAPPHIETFGPGGGRPEGDTFILWRTVKFQVPLPSRQEGRGTPWTPPPDAIQFHFAKASQLLIVGMNAAGYRARIRAADARTAVVLIVGGICVFAIVAGWTLSIRSRILAEELKVVRARAAHLEELSLAATGLAHETRNPLGIILGLAQHINRNPEKTEDNRIKAEHIVDAADRAAARLGDFMTYAKPREVRLTHVDGCVLLENVLDILRPDFDAAKVRLELVCDPLRIEVDEDMFRQVLVNLLLNSLNASGPETTVTVRLESRDESAVLEVEDHGHGILPELLPNILKPYVTGDTNGHGLGLAIVQRFVNEQGWRMRVESEPERGTRVVISGIAVAGTMEPKA